MSTMRPYVITVEDTKTGAFIKHEITSYSPVRALEHAVNNTMILESTGALGEEWK